MVKQGQKNQQKGSSESALLLPLSAPSRTKEWLIICLRKNVPQDKKSFKRKKKQARGLGHFKHQCHLIMQRNQSVQLREPNMAFSLSTPIIIYAKTWFTNRFCINSTLLVRNPILVFKSTVVPVEAQA